jgi:Ca2+-transporting ATPase
MTVGALVAYQIGNSRGGAITGATMLLTTLSLFHLVAGLLSRDQLHTIFDRSAIPAAAQLRRYGLALLAIIAVTMLEPLRRIVGTTELSLSMWATCIGLALSLVIVEELIKVVLRRRERDTAAVRPRFTARTA